MMSDKEICDLCNICAPDEREPCDTREKLFKPLLQAQEEATRRAIGEGLGKIKFPHRRTIAHASVAGAARFDGLERGWNEAVITIKEALKRGEKVE